MPKDKSSPLHLAVFRGHLPKVKRLIEDRKMNVNGKFTPEQNSPLFISCMNGFLDITEYLIEKGADVNAKNGLGFAPLYVAAVNGHLEIVKLLIKNGAKINIVGGKGKTPLVGAARKGCEDIVYFLLKNGANCDIKFGKSNTILHEAAKNGNLQLVEYLIANKNIDVNILGAGKTTPLFKAVERGHLETVRFLVEHGAEINIQTSTTPLITAIKNKFVDVVKLLLEKGADSNLAPPQCPTTPLLLAVNSNNTEIVKYLIKYKAEVNSDRLLHLSARRGNVDVFKLLVLNNPEVKKIIPSLLEIAAKNPEISEFLNQFQTYKWDVFEVVPRNKKDFVACIVSGGILNQLDRRGNTLLHLAVQYGCLTVAKILLDGGANPNIVNVVGNTPLILAVRAENDQIVALLLKYDVDINLTGHSTTPLFEAIQNENFDIFKMLVEKGARLDQRFPQLNHLIDEVAESGRFERIKFLIRSNVSQVDSV